MENKGIVLALHHEAWKEKGSIGTEGRGYRDFGQHLPFRSGEEGEAAEPRPRADDGGRLQDRDERRRPGHRGQAQHQVGQGEAALNYTEAHLQS